MKNKNGFTMVELLATIIILGILATIGIMSITGLLNRSKETYLESQTKMVVMAGKSYFNDYRNKLPKSIGPIASVKLQTLIDLKYIDPVKDEKGKICVDNENISKIYVQKVNKEEYKYTGYLSCSGKESSKLDTEKPVITFNPNNIISDEKTTLKMKITDNIKVLSYRYVIYKDDKEYLDTGYKVYTKNPTIVLNTAGVYKIKGYAYDTSGNSGIKDSGSYTITIKAPACTNATIVSNITQKTWIKENISFTIEPKSNTIESFTVKDSINNNGKIISKTLLKRETFSKKKLTLKDSGIHTITLVGYNPAGISCTVNIGEYYIDKEKPLKPEITNPTGGNWSKKDFSLILKANDTLSGIAYYQYSYDNITWTTYANSASNSFVTPLFSKEGNNKIYLRVVDKVGNISDVANTSIKIDKTAPSKPGITNPTNGSCSNNGFSLTASTNENGSGVSYWQYTYASIGKSWVTYANSASTSFTTTKFSASRNEDAYLRACDKVGNCSAESSTKIHIGGCSTPIYICRKGNTCIHRGAFEDCSWTLPYMSRLEVKSHDAKWYLIVSGVHNGHYVRKKCTTAGATCDAVTCPG